MMIRMKKEEGLDFSVVSSQIKCTFNEDCKAKDEFTDQSKICWKDSYVLKELP